MGICGAALILLFCTRTLRAVNSNNSSGSHGGNGGSRIVPPLEGYRSSLNITGPLNSFMEQVEERQRQQSTDGQSEPSEAAHEPAGLEDGNGLVPPGQRPVVQLPPLSSGPSIPAPTGSIPAYYHHPAPLPNYGGITVPGAGSTPIGPHPPPSQSQVQPYGPITDPGLQRLLASFGNVPANQPVLAPMGHPLAQTFDMSAQPPVVYGGISGEGTGTTHVTVSYVTCHVGCSHVTSIVNGGVASQLSHASSPSNQFFMLLVAALCAYFVVM